MKKALILLLLLLSLRGFSQPAQQSLLFQKTWGDPNCNYLEYADELPEGGYIVTGTKREGNVSGPIQIYVSRLDVSGNLIWEREIGTSLEDDWLVQTLKTKQGHYFVLSTAGNAVSFGGDVHATLLDKNGAFIFDQFYYQNTGVTDYAAGVCETNDNCYLISCALGILSQGLRSPTLIKIDSLGNELWRVRQDSLSEYNLRYVVNTPDNGCILTGEANSFRNNNSFVAKFGSDGNLQWIKYPYGINDTLINEAATIFVNNDGSFNIPFNQEIVNSNQFEAKWIDFDMNGNITDFSIIPFLLTFPYKARPAIDPFDSSYIISNNPYPNEYRWICKLHQDKTYETILKPTTANPEGGGIFVLRTRDGGYFAAGAYSPDPVNSCSMFHVAKFASNLHYDAKAYDKTVRVYPNPSANGIFNLIFEMETDDYVEVKIHSVDGKLVFSDRFFCPANTYTEYPVHLDLKRGSSGMYFFEAKTSTSSYFKKLITVQSD